ncbi:MAG: hypothetical protein ACT4P1_03225 [Sporichthyaceae bacterium]
MTRLIVNRLLSFLLGAALIAAGLTALVDGLRVAFDRSPWIIAGHRSYAEGRSTQLGDGVVLTAALLAAAVGLLLLVFQLWRRPPRRLRVSAPAVGARESASAMREQWWLARRGTERLLASLARGDAAVAQSSVALRRRRRGWSAQVDLTPTSADAATDTAARRIRETLDDLAADEVSVRGGVLTGGRHD